MMLLLCFCLRRIQSLANNRIMRISAAYVVNLTTRKFSSHRFMNSTLYDRDSLRKVGISVHGSECDMGVRHDNEPATNRTVLFAVSTACARNSQDKPRFPFVRGRQEKNDELGTHSTNPRRYIGVVRAPFLGERNVEE